MKIYMIRPNDDYQDCILVNNNNDQISDVEFNGEIADYNIRNVKFIDKDKILGDVAWYWSSYGTLIINQKAKDIFDTYFNNIQYIPVNTLEFSNKKFYLMNVLRYYDVIDIQKSEYTTMSNIHKQMVISRIRKYKFHDNAKNLDIFKTTNYPTNCYYFDIFVTDKFIDIIHRHNLKGFAFKEVDEIID